MRAWLYNGAKQDWETPMDHSANAAGTPGWLPLACFLSSRRSGDNRITAYEFLANSRRICGTQTHGSRL